MPPPGQEGRGSYVWVPNTGSDNNRGDVAAEEQLDTQTFVADLDEEDNDGSAQTASEELYEDPYAANIVDFDDRDDNNEQEMEDIRQVACIIYLLCSFVLSLIHICSKQPSAIAGPSTSTVYLEDTESPPCVTYVTYVIPCIMN